jgi:hypothetical protein
MTPLRQFLNAHRATTNTTHLSLAPGGKYCVNDTDLPDLYRLVAAETGPKHVLETHASLTAGPLLIDLDFEYPEEPRFHTRQYKVDEIDKFIECIHEAVTYFYGPLDDVEYVVSEKLAPTIEAGKRVKDGLHVLGRNLILSYKDQLQLRLYALEKHFLQTSFDTVHVKNEMLSVYDIAVIQRNAWYLMGCSKPDRAPYLPTRSYNLADGSLGCRIVGVSDYSIADMSIRCGGVPRDLRAEAVADWPGNVVVMMKARGKGKGRAPKATSEPTLSHVDETGSVLSHKSDGISKLLKMDGMEWNIVKMDDGFKLTHNSHRCLVVDDATHSAMGHSCVFVQRTCANIFCFSHKTKPLSKALSKALWSLVCPQGRTDAHDVTYTTRKAEFEKGAFRVRDPPGYMEMVGGKWVFYNRQQITDMNSGIFLDDAKKERFIDWWLRDDTIRTFDRLAYYVDARECPEGVFNTFTGFAAATLPVDPVDISGVLYHIQLLCNHNADAAEFLLDWMASVLQYPGKLNGICVVIIGDHGCGKDILFNWFGAQVIGLGAYYKTARPHIDLFGAFNCSRKNVVFYQIEEGNSAAITEMHVEQFKNYITDPYASIQMKGRDTTSDSLVKNYNHFLMSSNYTVPFTKKPTERRIVANRASNEKCRDFGYFTHLAETVLADKRVVRTFYDFLMNRDISRRDWCNPPETDAMREWKFACESDIQQFLDSYKEENTTRPLEIKASEFYVDYKAWCRTNGSEALGMRHFGIEMNKVTGVETIHKKTGNYYKL